MATKRKAGSSLAALQRTAASLRKKIAAQNKKKRDAQRAIKLKRKVESLRAKLKTTHRSTRRK